MNKPPVFVHFEFLRLDGRFHALQQNEKLVARQEFLSCAESLQKRISLLSYSLSGLRADCDVLWWRAAEDPAALQESSDRMRGRGLGKYLVPVRAYLATAPEPPAKAGEARHLWLCAATRSPGQVRPAEERAPDGPPSIRRRVFEAAGPGGETLFTWEGDSPAEIVEALRSWSAGPAAARWASWETYPCIRRELHDISEAFE